MTFAAPWALLGLLAAAVPVLLHLVQRRDPPERLFPAIQYLEDATREHRRRLRVRHWLLLACRTLLVVALVGAAAGPLARRAVPLGRHAPSALVLVVDNSPSSAAVVEGAPLLDALLAEARAVVSRATPADRLWLVLADGVTRPGTATELLARLDDVTPVASRLDLGAALRQGRELIRSSGRAGEVVLVTDAQVSAVAPAADDIPVVVLRPEGAAPPNRAIVALDPGAQPWGPEGDRIQLLVAGSDTAPVPLTVQLDAATRRDVLVTPGLPVSHRLAVNGTGWRTIRAELPPDELRADDEQVIGVRIAPPAQVSWDASDRFVSAALEVLLASGRVQRGDAVRIGGLGAGASIVVPPEDAALLGALNRSLATRGIAWRYGSAVLSPTQSDSSALLPERVAVTRRVRLEATGAGGDTLATVAGEPWIVRSGTTVLVGSRFDPSWTALPLTAAFVPLLDGLATRSVRGEPVVSRVTAGTPTVLPGAATAVAAHGGTPGPVEGGALWTPPAPGGYWLFDGRDTIGALSATIDPRESSLRRATDAELAAAWPGVVVAALDGGASRAFVSGGRGDLRPLLLVLAVLAVLGESLLAGRRRD
jgi:hypothetical protein